MMKNFVSQGLHLQVPRLHHFQEESSSSFLFLHVTTATAPLLFFPTFRYEIYQLN
jgi:hypothetical protein